MILGFERSRWAVSTTMLVAFIILIPMSIFVFDVEDSIFILLILLISAIIFYKPERSLSFTNGVIIYAFGRLKSKIKIPVAGIETMEIETKTFYGINRSITTQHYVFKMKDGKKYHIERFLELEKEDLLNSILEKPGDVRDSV